MRILRKSSAWVKAKNTALKISSFGGRVSFKSSLHHPFIEVRHNDLEKLHLLKLHLGKQVAVKQKHLLALKCEVDKKKKLLIIPPHSLVKAKKIAAAKNVSLLAMALLTGAKQKYS